MSKRKAWNSTLPAPTEPMKRTKPIKARNADRKAREFARTYHSVERVMFVKYAMQCEVPGCGHFPCECAHIEGEGMGRKGHYTMIVPLCAHHHRTGRFSFHNLGSRHAFEREYRIDLGTLAEWTEERWQTYGQSWVQAMKASGQWERYAA